MEPSLTEDSKNTFSEHQAALAQVLKEELDKHSAAGADTAHSPHSARTLPLH